MTTDWSKEWACGEHKSHDRGEPVDPSFDMCNIRSRGALHALMIRRGNMKTREELAGRFRFKADDRWVDTLLMVQHTGRVHGQAGLYGDGKFHVCPEWNDGTGRALRKLAQLLNIQDKVIVDLYVEAHRESFVARPVKTVSNGSTLSNGSNGDGDSYCEQHDQVLQEVRVLQEVQVAK